MERRGHAGGRTRSDREARAPRGSSRLIEPPSPRSTSSGTSSPASSSACSTSAAVRSTTGRIARVDRGADGPHLEAVGAGQLVADAGREARARARSRATSRSCAGASTANAPLTAIAAQPAADELVERGVDVVRRRRRRSHRRRRARSRARGRVRARRADARALARRAEIGLGADAEHADARRRRPRAGRSSPGSSRTRRARRGAVLAELVEERAEHPGDPLRDTRRLVRGRGTTACARSLSGAVSTATAFVNVPPTSTPIRIAPLTHATASAAPAAPGRTSEDPGGAEDVDAEQRRLHDEALAVGWIRSARRRRRAAAPSRRRPA